MQDAHRRYLVLEQGVGAVLLNFVINFAIAWAAFRGMSAVPMWGPQSIAGDTLATSFLLPFLTVLILTPLARREVTRGRLPAFERVPADSAVLRLLPSATFRRAVGLGAAATALIAPLAILAFHTAALDGIDAVSFMWIKAAYAGILAGIVSPLIAARALADTSTDPGS
jgi:hypothetical protein